MTDLWTYTQNLEPAKVLAYFIGLFAVVLEWASYTKQEGKDFRLWSGLAAVLWSVMYLLLGAWVAALGMFTTAIRTWLSRTFDGSHVATVAFILLFLGFAVLAWQGWVSLLPAFAAINTTLALFYFENLKMRRLLLLSSAAWIANDIYWAAWPALVAEGVAVAINVRTIKKLSRRKC